jgi:hypothetical protein
MPPALKTTLRLDSTQYFPVETEKTGICIHHTVGGSARSTFDYWNRNAEKVGVAYIIDRDGTIDEVFPPRAWAFQFGLSWPDAARIRFEKRFVGIEIASEGGLVESGGKLYAFDRAGVAGCERPRAGAFDYGTVWRSYRWYDQYEPAQVTSLIALINHLCDSLSIPRRVPARFLGYYGDTLRDFQGVIGHTMVRSDKTDPLPDVSFWKKVAAGCGLAAVGDAVAASPPRAQGMTPAEIDALFEANVQVILKMNTAAGSMVKGLIQELGRGDRATYISLRAPEPGGHAVSYDFRQGDESLVGRIGRALGLTITTDRIEVPGA